MSISSSNIKYYVMTTLCYLIQLWLQNLLIPSVYIISDIYRLLHINIYIFLLANKLLLLIHVYTYHAYEISETDSIFSVLLWFCYLWSEASSTRNLGEWVQPEWHVCSYISLASYTILIYGLNIYIYYKYSHFFLYF